MDTAKLKKFAQAARRSLMGQVATQLDYVLAEGSSARRESSAAVAELEKQLKLMGREQLVEKVAYIWFNRLIALRFMDLNRYTPLGLVSPAAGFTQPEILQEAKQGHIDENLVPEAVRKQVQGLLSGSSPSSDPQNEAYRLLLVAACNYYNTALPFMFERIADYTELLMPRDLLSESSILAEVRSALSAEDCQDVEVIGWLYQFYISEKKDEVFDGLKKNKKITPENIPAATQLFTPHWIVRYLVENSLGRLWLLNRPGSKLAEQMDYYIKPEAPETDFLRIGSPEELKICDPACGSGHMLTYAFDLLYAIYAEEGYEPAEIPRLILENNLYGLEIDERASELAAFALTMKARAKYRRFLTKPVQPHICRLENVSIEPDKLKDYMAKLGSELFTLDLRETLHQFEEADNFGSLIRPKLTDVRSARERIAASPVSENWMLTETHQKVLKILDQAEYLSPKYHVVIANPPYMGGKGMNPRLGAWVKDNYPDSKSDLFAMFIERNLDMAMKSGAVAMITMQSWMFLSSFEALRARLLGQSTLLSMAHLGARAFDSIGGEVVSTTAFVLENVNRLNFQGGYLRLVDGNSEAIKEAALLEAITNPTCGWFYRASTAEFKKIPSSPIAYWVSVEMTGVFADSELLSKRVRGIQGIITGDNGSFLRFWPEVSRMASLVPPNIFSYQDKGESYWVPYAKGGEYRRWYGNNEYLLYWKDEGAQLTRRRSENSDLYFRPCISWNKISTRTFAARYLPQGYVWDVAGSSVFPYEQEDTFIFVALLCSKVAGYILSTVSPTINYEMETVLSFPCLRNLHEIPASVIDYANRILVISTRDWDSYETSWDFTNLPLLNPDYRQPSLKATYQKLRAHWQAMILEMQRLEQENNRIFIEAYGLQDELTPEVPLGEITLTCNPHYRYGGDKPEDELEALLLADTLRELVSYAVGCMFGRYSLDEPGLILANQGETLADYLKRIPEPSFRPDDDNVIPLLDGEWFPDDIAARFCVFLRQSFGEEHYAQNLAYVEKGLGKDIRKYFLKDFYADHLKRYKKRPIYWLFSSPKGSFNALVYLHRYRPDTVSVVLQYLRDYRAKLTSYKAEQGGVSISAGASQGDKTRALKELDRLRKVLDELDEYERETLFPLAARKLEIDLDDGVKVNYLKFGRALKTIPGLESKED